MDHGRNTSRRSLLAIGAAIGVWGLLLALGAYLELGQRTPDGDRDPRKFWIVLAVTAGFLLFWAAAVAFRRRRIASRPANHRSIRSDKPIRFEKDDEQDS